MGSDREEREPKKRQQKKRLTFSKIVEIKPNPDASHKNQDTNKYTKLKEKNKQLSETNAKLVKELQKYKKNDNLPISKTDSKRQKNCVRVDLNMETAMAILKELSSVQIPECVCVKRSCNVARKRTGAHR